MPRFTLRARERDCSIIDRFVPMRIGPHPCTIQYRAASGSVSSPATDMKEPSGQWSGKDTAPRARGGYL
jgi:hypothetical protein